MSMLGWKTLSVDRIIAVRGHPRTVFLVFRFHLNTDILNFMSAVLIQHFRAAALRKLCWESDRIACIVLPMAERAAECNPSWIY